MSPESERRLILEMIERGKITAEEGLALLKALPASYEPEAPESIEQPELIQLHATEPIGETPQADPGEPQPSGRSEPERLPDMERFRNWWAIPLWVGAGILALGGGLMYWAQRSSGYGFWFYCAWVPFFIGLGLMALAWQSRTARWLHLRVYEPDKSGERSRKIAISMPVPIRLGAWFLRTFKGKISGLDNVSADQMLLALETQTSSENPVYIEVDDDDGEHVEIYIG